MFAYRPAKEEIKLCVPNLRQCGTQKGLFVIHGTQMSLDIGIGVD